MLAVPRTPKLPRHLNPPETPHRSVFRTAVTPVSKPQFFLASNALKDQISLGNYVSSCDIISPPVTRRKFIPGDGNTSTPAEKNIRLRGKPSEPTAKAAVFRMRDVVPDVITIDSDEELDISDHLPGAISPQPRPDSEPLFRRENSTPVCPRPLTAEPSGTRRLIHRSPMHKRIVSKCTFAKTPHCARPTKAWLNRMACFKREE